MNQLTQTSIIGSLHTMSSKWSQMQLNFLSKGPLKIWREHVPNLMFLNNNLRSLTLLHLEGDGIWQEPLGIISHSVVTFVLSFGRIIFTFLKFLSIKRIGLFIRKVYKKHYWKYTVLYTSFWKQLTPQEIIKVYRPKFWALTCNSRAFRPFLKISLP